MKVIVQTTIARMKAHPLYLRAKAGEPDAALDLVSELMDRNQVQDLLRNHPKAIVVAVHAEEMSGRNKIPLALSFVLGQLGGNRVDDQIVQSNRVFHTGADAMTRLFMVPEFYGAVTAGADYIIVDDVATSGSTLSGLKRYIERNGATVVGAVAMAASSNPQTGYGGQLAITEETLKRLALKFDMVKLIELLRQYGIADQANQLTNSQGLYLSTFKSVDTIRDRIIAARQAAGLETNEGKDEGSVEQEFNLEDEEARE